MNYPASHRVLAFVCLCQTLPFAGSVQAQGKSVAPESGYEITYATYLGGSAWDQAREIIPQVDGTVLVGGMTASSDMAATPGVVQPEYAGDDPALGHGGVIGGDAFLVRLSPNGTKILAATYFGGSKQERGEFYLMPTPDRDGNIFVVGHGTSADFPVTPSALQSALRGGRTPQDGDGILAVLSPDGSRLLYATYLGGNGDDLIRSVALGPNGEVYLVGSTSSTDFPVTSHAVQRRLVGGADAFVVKQVPRRK